MHAAGSKPIGRHRIAADPQVLIREDDDAELVHQALLGLMGDFESGQRLGSELEIIHAGPNEMAARAVVLFENLNAFDLGQAITGWLIDALGRHLLGDQA